MTVISFVEANSVFNKMLQRKMGKRNVSRIIKEGDFCVIVSHYLKALGIVLIKYFIQGLLQIYQTISNCIGHYPMVVALQICV
jgi:hypothetical protein